MRRAMLAALTLIIAVTAVSAQEAEKKAEARKEMPPGWKMRLDRAAADPAEFQFWTMPPGWHITTGPAAITYDPAKTATGNYRVESETFLFPGDHLEGFGFFFGGQNLDQPSQSYTYFLIRKDGKFIIKSRKGDKAETLVPWTENAAIVPHDGSKQTAKNVLAVEVGAENVDFYVNGQKIHSLPRTQVATDGVAGLRVNHHVNVHITSLTVTPK